MENKELVTGEPTGYYQFDEYTAGLQPSDLIIVAGRPSMGKTAFAMNVAMRAAALHGVPTPSSPWKLSMEQIMAADAVLLGQGDLSHLRRGRLDDEDWSRLYDAANHLTDSPIFVDDTAAITHHGDAGPLPPAQGRAWARAHRGSTTSTHAGLAPHRFPRAGDFRYFAQLKGPGQGTPVPVIALSQLNRKVEERRTSGP
jgi:replicative DNA helicase